MMWFAVRSLAVSQRELSFLGVLVGTCLVVPQAGAQAVYDGFGYVGDGHIPTMQEHIDATGPSVASAASLGSVGEDGAVQHAVSIETPGALVSPSVSLQYASGGGHASWMSEGWTLSVGASISRPSRAQEAGVYADLGDVWMYSGPGGSGAMVQGTSGEWHLRAGGAMVTADYDAATRVWTVTDGALTLELSPRVTADWSALGIEPRNFRIDRMTDVSGNEVTYAYSSDRIDTIEFGQNVHDATLYPATGRIQFVWESLPATTTTERARISQSWSEGVAEVYDHRLSEVRVSARKIVGHTWKPYLSYLLAYEDDTQERAPRLVGVDLVGR
jgi:hypothetical protein